MDGTWVAPRKKIKYSTNPNGNDWANDTSGFGHKMLERLGWCPGTGLGKNRNGITTSLKPKGQRSTTGLGKKVDYSFAGTQQLDDYAKLLKSLNESYNSSRKPSSSVGLEELSKSNQKRLHYSKLVRAKDASKYDNRSLAAILGKSAVSSGEVQKTPGEELATSSNFGVITTRSALSMTEYFEQRSLSKRKGSKDGSIKSTERRESVQNVSSSVGAEGGTCAITSHDIIKGSPEHFPSLISPSENSAVDNLSGVVETIPESSVFRTTNLLSLSGYIHY